MTKLYKFILTILLFLSCIGLKEYHFNLKQIVKIDNKKPIYLFRSYNKNGMLITTKNNTTIDSQSIFIDDATPLMQWRKDTLIIIVSLPTELFSQKNLNPIKTSYINLENYKIKTEAYVFNSMKNIAYNIDSYTFTNDSVYFTGVKEEHSNLRKFNIAYPLNSVILSPKENDRSVLNAISILLFEKAMDFTYNNGNGNYTFNLPRIEMIRYDYYIKKNIPINKIPNRNKWIPN